MHANYKRAVVWWKDLIINMILEKKIINQIIITIDLEALQFNGFLN